MILISELGLLRCTYAPVRRTFPSPLTTRCNAFAAKGIIHYTRQTQIDIRKILSAGDAAYRPGRGWWECTARAKYDIYDCLVYWFTAK